MKRCLLPVLALITVFTQLRAQEIDFERWEVGIDLLPLIGKNQVVPSFFVKKLDLKQKRKGTGFIRRGPRFRTGIAVNSLNNPLPFKQTSYDVLFRPGYEWDRKIKSVNIILALDAVAGFYNSYEYDFLNSNRYWYTEQRFGVSPVAGVSYQIVQNIRVSIESAMDILFRHTRTNYEFARDPYTVGVTNKGLVIRAMPLYVLNASFVF